jgi:hypothetical protein
MGYFLLVILGHIVHHSCPMTCPVMVPASSEASQLDRAAAFSPKRSEMSAASVIALPPPRFPRPYPHSDRRDDQPVSAGPKIRVWL